MTLVRLTILTFLLAIIPIDAQTGVLEVNGRIKVDGKQERLKRKRFYLFRGGLTANKALVDRIRTAEFVTICRMRSGDNELALNSYPGRTASS